MSGYIIKQPNGKHAVWSEEAKNFELINATEEGVKEYKIGRFMKRMKLRLNGITDTIEKLDKGENPYLKFDKSFEKCINTMDEEHSEEVKNEILDKIDM